MELDKLKSEWADLDNRLKKTEIINNKIITDMIKSRTDSGIGGLKKYEIKILILSIFVIG